MYANGAVELSFSHVDGGIRTSDGQPFGSFSVSDKDGRWEWAQAQAIAPDKLRVWSVDVPAPVAVRYAWSDNPPAPNLTDAGGIPASPFHSDVRP